MASSTPSIAVLRLKLTVQGLGAPISTSGPNFTAGDHLRAALWTCSRIMHDASVQLTHTPVQRNPAVVVP